MSWKKWIAVGVVGVTAAWTPRAHAGDIKITLPKRSHETPVQRLNQEGVDAVLKHDYEKAETLFYKAYLLDPDDPFTLNNLGYVSELQGQVDRAQNFYKLAGLQPTDAVIDRASSARLKGHSVSEALNIPDTPLRLNHDSVEAVRLLSQGRASEVDILLQHTLKQDPQNIFALNNMGVAKEMEGETQEALKYYDTAAAIQSNAAGQVTSDRESRGKPVNEMAADNARNLRQRLANRSTQEQLAELNLRGVSAINRNDLATADQDFRRAYALDPFDAFALNNIGYVAELQGDRETAQFFYDRAREAGDANATVGLASRGSAKGMKLFEVAADNDSKVEAKLDQDRAAYRQSHEPIVLRHRDETPVIEPATPPPAATPVPQQQSVPRPAAPPVYVPRPPLNPTQ